MTNLESKLSVVIAKIETAEWQVDLLRNVLSGEVGTPDQRNALIRIIDQVKLRRPLMAKLERALNITSQVRSTYY